MQLLLLVNFWLTNWFKYSEIPRTAEVWKNVYLPLWHRHSACKSKLNLWSHLFLSNRDSGNDELHLAIAQLARQYPWSTRFSKKKIPDQPAKLALHWFINSPFKRETKAKQEGHIECHQNWILQTGSSSQYFASGKEFGIHLSVLCYKTSASFAHLPHVDFFQWKVYWTNYIILEYFFISSKKI